jgi:lipopolysaccharide export LptBFGC system permease protein LptF
MLKNKLYQYFITEFFKNFLFILFSLSLLMLLTQAARFLNIITEMGNSAWVYSKFVLLNYPRTIEKTVQFSFMISVFFTITKLRNEKELNIFWYSGVSRSRVFKIVFIATSLIFFVSYALSIFFAPYSLSKARQVIAKSEFTLINSLVKEKNFNSPLKKLTIYVDENDMKGNLKKIFIFEPSRTISAEKASIIKEGNIVFLELYNGLSQEKNNSKINTVKFEKLVFDFSQFTTKNLKVEKYSERNLLSLFDDLNLNKTNNKKDKENLRYEINKRLIKPFFIFFICALTSYIIFYDDIKRKYNSKIIIFILSFLSIVLNEILLGYSSKNFFFSIAYLSIILIGSVSIFFRHLRN